MVTLEERLSRLEGGYEHVATKADLADLKADLKSDIAHMESRLLRWMIGMMLTSTAVAVSIATLIQGFYGLTFVKPPATRQAPLL